MEHDTAPSTTPSSAPVEAPVRQRDRVWAAYRLLHLGFIALPLVMGLDKFINGLTYWPDYLAPWIVDILPLSAQAAMYAVGVVEICAALAMIVAPRIAAPVVALWLGGIIVNLLTYPGHLDVALRDLGLLIAALALALLAADHHVGTDTTHSDGHRHQPGRLGRITHRHRRTPAAHRQHQRGWAADLDQARRLRERWFPLNVLGRQRTRSRRAAPGTGCSQA